MPSIGQRLVSLFRTSQPAEAVPAPVAAPEPASKAEVTKKRLEAVREGEIDVAGERASKGLSDQRGALGGTAGFSGAPSRLSLQIAAKSGASIRPQRASFDSEEGYDEAYIAYQSAQMAKLVAQFPDAAVFGEIYHGTTLPPEVVFKDGVPAKGEGDCFDLAKHQAEFTTPDMPDTDKSALRGSCMDARTPAKFADEGGWVYILKPLGGAISLEGALGDKQHPGAKGETEFSFGARQPGPQIIAAYPVGKFSDVHDAFRLGKRIENPDAAPE